MKIKEQPLNGGPASSVNLTDRDFVAQGGEKKIYIKGTMAYGIYHDSSKCMSVGKATELSVLKKSSIVKPVSLLFDSRDSRVGEAMVAVPSAYVLCQLFTRDFREREGVETKHLVELLKDMQDTIFHVHSHGILIVDNNELNWLVVKPFTRSFAIDIANWQTPSYPAQFIMPNIRDPLTHGFNKGTDWFSFAIQAVQLLIGKHPYRVNHPDFESVPTVDGQRMLAMMKARVSIFDSKSRVPKVCYPLDTIPSVLRGWLVSVLEKGLREAPPKDYEASVEIVTLLTQITSSRQFEVIKLGDVDGDVLRILRLGVKRIIVTQKKVYVDKKSYIPSGVSCNCVKIGFDNLGEPVGVWIDSLGKVNVWNIESGDVFITTLIGSNLLEIGGRLLLLSRNSVIELTFMSHGKSAAMVSVRPVAQVLDLPNATRVFDGCIFQDMLGTNVVNIFPLRHHSYQQRLLEFDGQKVLDARYERGVLMVITTVKGDYNRYVYLAEKGFSLKLLSQEKGIDYSGMNWTVTTKGLFVNILGDGEATVCKVVPTEPLPRMVMFNDTIITTDMQLVAEEEKVLFHRGNEVYQLSLKR